MNEDVFPTTTQQISPTFVDCPVISAKWWPASDTVVLRPDSSSLGSVSCGSCGSCTHALHLVASSATGDPCLH